MHKKRLFTRFFFSEAFPVHHLGYSKLFIGLLMPLNTVCGHDIYVLPFGSQQPLRFIYFVKIQEHFTVNSTRSKILIQNIIWKKHLHSLIYDVLCLIFFGFPPLLYHNTSNRIKAWLAQLGIQIYNRTRRVTTPTPITVCLPFIV